MAGPYCTLGNPFKDDFASLDDIKARAFFFCKATIEIALDSVLCDWNLSNLGIRWDICLYRDRGANCELILLP